MPNAALFVSPGPLVDGSGNPYAGGKLNFYTTGTSSRLNTYSDSGLTSANTNPVVADINGKFGPIYLSANTSYKVVFATSADVTIWTWDPVQGISISATPSVGLLRSYLSGLTLSRNAGTPNTKIDVAAGACADSTNVLAMAVAAGTIDCGTVGVNGLDAGVLVLSTWYHAYAIAKVDGTTGLLASTSASSPVLPSGYTLFRRLGSFKTDASVHILAFVQIGDDFLWVTPVANDISDATLTTVLKSYTITVPPGVQVKAIMSGLIIATAGVQVGIVNPAQTGATGANTSTTLNTAGANGPWNTTVWTNTSQQIQAISSGASTSIVGNTIGWTDPRGKNT